MVTGVEMAMDSEKATAMALETASETATPSSTCADTPRG